MSRYILIKKYAISYGFSGSLWYKAQLTKTEEAKQNRLLAVAPEFSEIPPNPQKVNRDGLWAIRNMEEVSACLLKHLAGSFEMEIRSITEGIKL